MKPINNINSNMNSNEIWIQVDVILIHHQNKLFKFLQKFHGEKSRDKCLVKRLPIAEDRFFADRRRSLRAWARNVTGPIDKTRVSRKRCDRTRKILPEASFTAVWRGDQVVKGFRARTHYYATAFFSLFSLRTWSIHGSWMQARVCAWDYLRCKC